MTAFFERKGRPLGFSAMLIHDDAMNNIWVYICRSFLSAFADKVEWNRMYNTAAAAIRGGRLSGRPLRIPLCVVFVKLQKNSSKKQF